MRTNANPDLRVTEADRPIFENVELLRELRATARSAGDAVSAAFARGVVDGRRCVNGMFNSNLHAPHVGSWYSSVRSSL